MHVATAIPELNGCSCVERLKDEPSGCVSANNHRPITVEQQDGAVEQLLLSGKRDRELVALIRLYAQPTARYVIGTEGDIFDALRMCQAMQRLMQCRVVGVSDNSFDADDLSHRHS